MERLRREVGVCRVSLLGCGRGWRQAQGWGFLLPHGVFRFEASRAQWWKSKLFFLTGS